MGYVPEPSSPRLNLDRFGMPRDYATYVWLLYGRRVPDQSPQRLAFLRGSGIQFHHGSRIHFHHNYFYRGDTIPAELK